MQAFSPYELLDTSISTESVYKNEPSKNSGEASKLFKGKILHEENDAPGAMPTEHTSFAFPTAVAATLVPWLLVLSSATGR